MVGRASGWTARGRDEHRLLKHHSPSELVDAEQAGPVWSQVPLSKRVQRLSFRKRAVSEHVLEKHDQLIAGEGNLDLDLRYVGVADRDPVLGRPLSDDVDPVLPNALAEEAILKPAP